MVLLQIALLLLPFSSISGSGIDAVGNPVIAGPVSTNPFMTGVRLTSWDEQRQLFVLQIDSLESIEKTLGPLYMDDYRDISAINCYLRSGSASLAENLQEVGKLLAVMMESLIKPIPEPLSASPPQVESTPVTYTGKLVGLPPALKARPFSCAISQPQGTETFFRADLATFDPTETDITLEGNVEVRGGNQTRLTAEHMSWVVNPLKLNVEGDYCFQTGAREVKGRGASFSLSGGGIELAKSTETQTLPDMKELPSSAAISPLMIPGRGKSLRVRKKTILSYLSRSALKMMNSMVMLEEQRLASAKNQGKGASYPVQKFYPPSPTTRSLEEVFNRELFSEKCW
jgi:hypothetical protein